MYSKILYEELFFYLKKNKKFIGKDVDKSRKWKYKTPVSHERNFYISEISPVLGIFCFEGLWLKLIKVVFYLGCSKHFPKAVFRLARDIIQIELLLYVTHFIGQLISNPKKMFRTLKKVKQSIEDKFNLLNTLVPTISLKENGD